MPYYKKIIQASAAKTAATVTKPAAIRKRCSPRLVMMDAEDALSAKDQAHQNGPNHTRRMGRRGLGPLRRGTVAHESS